MKAINLFIIVLVFSCQTAMHANWYSIELKGALIPFGKIAKVGRVSVFIVSTPSCAPCKVLKANLYGDKSFNMQKIDFYDVNIASGITEKELRNTTEYRLWRQAERLESYPYIYILSPATNVVARGTFNASEVKHNINSLLEAFQGFDEKSMLAYDYQVMNYSHEDLLANLEGRSSLDSQSQVSNENRETNTQAGVNKDIPRMPNEVIKISAQDAKQNIQILDGSDSKMTIGVDIGHHPYMQNKQNIPSHLRVVFLPKQNWVETIRLFDNINFRVTGGGVFKHEDLERIRNRGAGVFNIILKSENEFAIVPLNGFKIKSIKEEVGGYFNIFYVK